MIFILYFFPLLSIPVNRAAGNRELGVGKVAETLLEPIGLLSDLISTTCFVIGGAFLFATIIKYIEHKRSPLMVPISTVIYLFIIGLVLVSLPFISLLTESGISYSLFK
ncbi:MAG: hypothetical protein A3F42_02965 [Gammaproteobacteria bacterium RIFCSPHIGHO2_12_FULL_37_34]|nr:MAG: hypothetical protein A3F42_02965 [Gammaproteobacteria bacterium RIFCSPHIGHO2_12_FULL_37_34]